MAASRDYYTNILRFWRAVETFSLPDIPAWKPSATTFFTELYPGDTLPWQPGQLPEPAAGKRWKHTLCFHVVRKEAVIALLAKLTGSAEFRDPTPGDTCLSALVVDASGCPGDRTFAPAAFIHALRLIREKRSPEQLADLLRTAREDGNSRFGLTEKWPASDPATEAPTPSPAKEPSAQSAGEETPTSTTVLWPALQKELDQLQRLAGKDLPATIPLYCISEQAHSAASLEAPFLNSYFLPDLDRLIQNPGDLGRPLEQLLTAEVVKSARVNLLEPQTLQAHLHPRYLTAGRWPADPTHSLYSAQQAALAITLPKLRNGSGLLGINGPPGTGKTTLLRELIADTIVTRARKLLQTPLTEFFSVKWDRIHDKAGCYRPHDTLFGDSGIVIAANNNTAVENISKELPSLRSIDPHFLPDADYFSGIATHILDEPCWGLLSAALGRSENRSAFIQKWWFTPGKGFNYYLREQYEDHRLASSHPQHFADTAAELTALFAEFDRFQSLAIAWYETGSPELAARLETEYEILPANLPTPTTPTTPSLLSSAPAPQMNALHRLTPFSSKKLNRLRSSLFLRSLELHEWAIRANARYFRTNLNTFIDMLAGKLRDHVDPDVAASLWNSFFFCVPVVSVTLASFERQFRDLRRGAIAWLLIDEAGQATLPSVCGAVWRSKRCIFIGDTLQIPPVVTIPRALDTLLQKHYGITGDCWSPTQNSAQSLADRITPIGTYVGETTWTGIPLRAHRRCQEPMFSLANTIAYNGQMVQVTPASPNAANAAGSSPSTNPAGLALSPSPGTPTTGPSGWFHISGSPLPERSHAIAEEFQIAEDLLQKLSTYPGKIFIISPFRAIADRCRERYNKKDRIQCGTIHTFQGKEADIVLLILGTTPANKKARDWVAASPNILNVAITRARHRLYVIGNRDLWSRHKHFDLLAATLPVRAHGLLL